MVLDPCTRKMGGLSVKICVFDWLAKEKSAAATRLIISSASVVKFNFAAIMLNFRSRDKCHSGYSRLGAIRRYHLNSIN